MKKLICFDMDGTVYLGEKLIDGALGTFRYLREHDIHFVFLTNNSSKNINTYQQKIKRLGIACDSNNFYSSIDVMVNYLKAHHARKICTIVTKDFEEILRKDFIIVRNEFDQPDFIVMGYDTEITYEKIRVAALYLQKGVKMVATNVDYRCPYGNDLYLPDCGSMIRMFECVTDEKPIFLGKPEPNIVLDLIEKYHLQKEDVLVIGDRLYTDVACGVNAGVDTVAVLSGEINQHDIDVSTIKPTYVLDSIKDLPNILK